jgi:hypothetical protein
MPYITVTLSLMATDDPTTSSNYGSTRTLLTLLATQFFCHFFLLLTYDSGGYSIHTHEADAHDRALRDIGFTPLSGHTIFPSQAGLT